MTWPVVTASPDRTTESWQRLNPRLIIVSVSVLAAPLATLAGTLLAAGGDVNLQIIITLGALLIAVLVIAGINMMRYLTTRYRITADRVELRSGLLFRSQRSVRLDRVRGVNVTAHPVHRIFGLTRVEINTAEQTSSASHRLRLDGVSKAQSVELRQLLMSRRTSAADSMVGNDGPIADLDWSWIRYMPLTIWGIGGVLIGIGTVYRTLNEMKIDPLQLGIVQDIEHRYGSVPLWFGVLVTVVTAAVIGAVGSTAHFTEGWYGYRLERGDGGTFRVVRGTLVARSVTIEARHVRGVELVEPIPLCWAGGARLHVVASGLGNAEENEARRKLTPPVPRAEALRVAADMLSEERSPTSLDTVTPHPRAALRRRIYRALNWTVLITAVPVLLGLLLWQWLLWVALSCVVVLLPTTLALAFDAYRTLGHGRNEGYIVTRAGTFVHRTVALHQEGVIGWNVSRSFFQRRLGLMTIGATTAAGDQVYKVRDTTVTEGLRFAETTPGQLTPFVRWEMPQGESGQPPRHPSPEFTH